MNKKISINTSTFGEYSKEPIDLLEARGLNVKLNPYRRKLNGEEVILLCKESVGIISGTEMIDKEILRELKNVKVISRCGVGLDNVDTKKCQELGVKVYNTPGAPTTAVAELTIGLMLDLLRKISEMTSVLKTGRWDKMMGNLLFGKKIGIIGFGRIGQKVAELLLPFGTEISYYDKEKKKTKIKCEYKDMKKLIEWADIITLHGSFDDKKTWPVIGANEIKSMHKGSWLVNVSRGGVIDENALYSALKTGHIAGAALDVFGEEPYKGPLAGLENVILTPHIGSYAKEARVKMEVEAVENLLEGLGITKCGI